jgi:uncharacterized membrane protein SpoIIM required for sporulation
MKQAAFESHHAETWSLLERLLEEAGKSGEANAQLEALPACYRKVCHHLAVARDRQYAPALVDRLNQLVLRGHQRLYGTRQDLLGSWLRFMREYPRVVRARWRPVLLAFALFFVPNTALIFAVKANPEIAYLVVDPHELAQMESMYTSGKEKFGRKDESDKDVVMFGFYIWNNLRITFAYFASGLTAGLLTALHIFWFGVYDGAISGHLTRVGLGLNFWSFVITHSALELTGALIAGGAGLHMGGAILFPKRRSRLRALRESSKDALTLLYGAAAMVFLAAFFEAFWSSSALIPPKVKFIVGGLLWVAVYAYLFLVGRAPRSSRA